MRAGWSPNQHRNTPPTCLMYAFITHQVPDAKPSLDRGTGSLSGLQTCFGVLGVRGVRGVPELRAALLKEPLGPLLSQPCSRSAMA